MIFKGISKRNPLYGVLWVVIFGVSYLLSGYSYLLFHTGAELFTVAVALCIFFIIWNSQNRISGNFFYVMGAAYLLVAIIHLLHTLSYKGMNLIPGDGANFSTQLWVLARYIESFSFVLAVLLIERKKIRFEVLVAVYVIVLIGALWTIFGLKIFPDCFIEASGLTLFKKISEYVVSLIFLTSGILFWKKRGRYDGDFVKWILLSIFFSIVAEMMFTAYVSVYGFTNFLGHMFALLSFYYIYRAFIREALANPLGVLFGRSVADEKIMLSTIRQWQKTFDAIKALVLVFDRHMRVVNANRSVIDLFGGNKINIQGSHCMEIFCDNPRGSNFCLFESNFTSGEISRMEAPGSVLANAGYPPDRLLEIVSYPVKDESREVQQLVVFIRDITDTREVKALRVSEKKFRDLTELLPEGIIETDKEGRFIYANRAFLEMTGYSQENIAGGLRVEDVIATQDIDLYRERKARMERDKNKPGIAAFRGKRKDGSILSVLVHTSVILDDKGEFAGTRSIVRDISFEKKMEEEKMKLEEQLRHSDRLATIGQLAAGVAHEINEPVGNILGFAELAKKIPGCPEQVVKDLDSIVEASLQARKIVKDLLGFSRQRAESRSWIDVNEIINSGLGFFGNRFDSMDVKVVNSTNFELPKVFADPAQVKQVLINLIMNALKAMPDGGTLTVKTGISGGECVITVEDTGTGMDEDVRSKIFDPFFTTRGGKDGTGLGLSLADGIVKSHGGRIKVDSTPGKGSRFEVLLPLEES